MSKETPNNEELYQALKQSAPDRAEGIVANYKVANELVSGALSGKKKEAAKQAKDQLSLIVKTIVDENAESRAGLVDAFSQELDHIASYFGEDKAIIKRAELAIAAVFPGGSSEAEPPTKKKAAPEIKVEKEQPTGFAQTYRESPLQEALDQMSDQQKKDILKELFKEAQEGKEIPKEVEMRLEQLAAIVTALESIKTNTRDSRTWSEKYKLAGTANAEVLRWSSLIEKMKELAIPAIVQEGMTLEQVFLKYNMEFGDKVKDTLKSFDETKEFFDKYDRLKDVTNGKDKIAYYGDLIKFLRDRKDYATAQAVMWELLDAEFERGREFMNRDLKDSLFDKASAKIDKRMTAEVRKQYRDKGLDNDQIQAVRDELVALEAGKLENDYITEHLLIGEGDDRTEGKMQAMVRDQNVEIWKQYKNMLDPKGEWFNLKDENWDMIIEELIISAPLILASGLVAGAVVKGLSAGTRMLLGGTKLASRFMRLAKGGTFARKVYQTGKLGGRAAGLLTEGAVFDLTHTGLQGQLLDSQKDWVKSILWTSATLGVFKGAGKIGKMGAEKFNGFLKNALPKIGDKKLVQLMNHLMIQGHTEVLAMLMVGALQHMSVGEFDEFYEHFGDQAFHAYVSIGALHIAGKVITTTTGKIFTPDGGGKKGGAGSKPSAEVAKPAEVKAEAKPEVQGSPESAKFTVRDLEAAAVSDTARFEAIVNSKEAPDLSMPEITRIFEAQTAAGIKPNSALFAKLLLLSRDVRAAASSANVRATIGMMLRSIPKALRGKFDGLLTGRLKPGSALAGLMVLFYSPKAFASGGIKILGFEISMLTLITLIYPAVRIGGIFTGWNPALSAWLENNISKTTDRDLRDAGDLARAYATVGNTGRKGKARITAGSEMQTGLNTAAGRLDGLNLLDLRLLFRDKALLGDYLSKIELEEARLSPAQGAELRTYRRNVENTLTQLNALLNGANSDPLQIRNAIAALNLTIQGNVATAEARAFFRRPVIIRRTIELGIILVILMHTGIVSVGSSSDDEKDEEEKKEERKERKKKIKRAKKKLEEPGEKSEKEEDEDDEEDDESHWYNPFSWGDDEKEEGKKDDGGGKKKAKPKTEQEPDAEPETQPTFESEPEKSAEPERPAEPEQPVEPKKEGPGSNVDWGY